jgi:hypothetical protein
MEVSMKMTDKEKGFLKFFRKLESPRCREDLISRAEAMVLAQEALKKDCGVGPDAPLFTGAARPVV